MGKLCGEREIEATMQRLNRLTLDEGRATAAQTLEVIHGLVHRWMAIMDGAHLVLPLLPAELLTVMLLDADGNESGASDLHGLNI